MDPHQRMAAYQARVEAALSDRLPPEDQIPRRLHEAMRYVALGGGKRVRPLLVYFTGEVLDLDPAVLDAPACAIELIHAYSLVHDDLPAMDDDDMRRGRPTCHIAYDEATAILVGDALQVLAFEILGTDPTLQRDTDTRLAMINLLSTAAGPSGMAGGQAIDVENTGKPMSRDELAFMHRLKTGALIRASVLLAAHCRTDLSPERRAALERFSELAGHAFQVQDDILDVEGEAERLGKTPGADEARHKPTYPSIVGLDEAKRIARELYQSSLDALADFGDKAEPLRWLAAYIIERDY
ncbi:MAG: farnesyl diphosphate synthase [Pseudomonadota bacterium]